MLPHGLALSANGGSIGINFPAGQSLALENSIINGFQSYGVVMIRTNDTNVPRMTITNSTIRNNLYGVYTSNSGVSVTAGVTIANSSVSRNLSVGIDGADNTTAAVSDTVLAENNVAVLASSTASLTPPQIALERCTISRNGTGLYAGAGVGQVPHGTVRIAHNLITGNDTGVVEAPDGSIQSMTSVGIATNTIEGNGTDGTFSGSFAAK